MWVDVGIQLPSLATGCHHFLSSHGLAADRRNQIRQSVMVSDDIPHGTDWVGWLDGLDEGRRRFAVKLYNRFATLGADGPEEWTRSKVTEDIAQLTLFLFLRTTGSV